MNQKPPEFVILVDETDQALGSEEKIAAHKKALCHRAFSVFIIRKIKDDIEILMHQRHPNKYHCGNLWTNTCCGHPRPGEKTKAAATRRLFEEMGIQSELIFIDKFHYIAPFDNGLTENEIDHVFFGKLAEENFTVNSVEVSQYRWQSVSTLEADLVNNPNDYTPWLAKALNLLKPSLSTHLE